MVSLLFGQRCFRGCGHSLHWPLWYFSRLFVSRRTGSGISYYAPVPELSRRRVTLATKKKTPTFDELSAQIAALQAQAADVRRKEVAEVISKIKSAVAHYGLTAEDLGLAAKGPKKYKLTATVAPTTKGSKKVPKAAAAKKSVKPIKYQDEAGNAWVGHGKRPKWFVDAIAGGKTAEDLLVKPAA